MKRKLIIWDMELEKLPRVQYKDIKLGNYKWHTNSIMRWCNAHILQVSGQNGENDSRWYLKK